MKIIFSSHHNPHFPTITEYIEAAIRNLGHELSVFEDRQHIIPGRIRTRLPFVNQLDQKVINKKLLALAEEVKPDIVIIAGGHRIAAQTIRYFKSIGVISVLWTIDAPCYFQPIIDTAPCYDYIFCQGTEAVELLTRAGIAGARWLPMACDPDEHHPVECTAAEKKEYGSDVVFVGSYYPNRETLFQNLVDYDFAIWGPGWNRLDRASPLYRYVREAHTTPAEWLKIYSSSKIVLATHYRDPQNRFPVYQASPRVFEALACRAFVLCDNQKDVFSLFQKGQDLVCFDEASELIAQIDHYLAYPQECEKIAAFGRQTVIAGHTYRHRIKELLASVTYE